MSLCVRPSGITSVCRRTRASSVGTCKERDRHGKDAYDERKHIGQFFPPKILKNHCSIE